MLYAVLSKTVKVLYLGESLSASLIIRKDSKLILEELSLHDSVGFGIGGSIGFNKRLYFIPQQVYLQLILLCKNLLMNFVVAS